MSILYPAPVHSAKPGARRPSGAGERAALAARRRLVAQLQAGVGEAPGPGGWSGGFANQAHWDPTRPREWRCWAQSGPTWSAHCGAEVAAHDSLGLCLRHRRALLEGDIAAAGEAGPGDDEGLESADAGTPEPALSAG
jgi:hypothetical protein